MKYIFLFYTYALCNLMLFFVCVCRFVMYTVTFLNVAFILANTEVQCTDICVDNNDKKFQGL